MEWLNIFGLGFTIIIMIPNIIYAVKCRDGFESAWRNRAAELLEQIGRYACLAFMIIIIPDVQFGFPSGEAFVLYLIVNGALTLAYCVI